MQSAPEYQFCILLIDENKVAPSLSGHGVISQSSAATCLRSDGQCYMDFVANFILFLAVKQTLKIG